MRLNFLCADFFTVIIWGHVMNRIIRGTVSWNIAGTLGTNANILGIVWGHVPQER
jgi:hypothetical protein